ncbi:MAG: ferrous iron transport protein A [Acidobacteria bacterium]|nr:ferrous iron transport protein A [Acidobacteriota bacterium]
MPDNTNTTLADLDPGDRAAVIRIGAELEEGERRRLLELGLFPGTVVEAVLDSPLGDPTAYRVRDITVALRREQAQWIEVRHVS